MQNAMCFGAMGSSLFKRQMKLFTPTAITFKVNSDWNQLVTHRPGTPWSHLPSLPEVLLGTVSYQPAAPGPGKTSPVGARWVGA